MSKEFELLKIPPNAVHDLRKLYNLDGLGRMEEAIEILEKWIQQERHIIKKDFDRKYLERVLILSKGSIEKAKSRIDALCTMRTLTPNLFIMNNTKAELLETAKIVKIIPLPTPTVDLYRIFIIKVNDASFTNYQLLMALKYIILLAEYVSRHDYVKGFIFVDDFRGFNMLQFVTKLNTVEMHQFASIMLKGFGSRINALHLVTESKMADLFISFLTKVISPKITGRIGLHKNFDVLLDKVLPKDNFPEDYGGKERSSNAISSDWIDMLFSEENLKNFNLSNEARTDETLRSSDKFITEYMGMPGSFRNLTVD